MVNEGLQKLFDAKKFSQPCIQCENGFNCMSDY
jgi:hypothetical protein